MYLFFTSMKNMFFLSEEHFFLYIKTYYDHEIKF